MATGPAFGMEDWTDIDPADAARHPSYGLGGLLLVFAAILLFGVVVKVLQLPGEIAGAMSEFPSAEELADEGAIVTVLSYVWNAFLVVFPILDLVVLVVMLWMLAMRHHYFTTVTGFYMIANIVVYLPRAAQDGGYLDQLWFLCSIIGLVYVCSSARVMVTYLGKVRLNDPMRARDAGPA